jgi:hypothetical protein
MAKHMRAADWDLTLHSSLPYQSCKTNPQDRRTRVLSLTDEGHGIFARLRPVVQSVQGTFVIR